MKKQTKETQESQSSSIKAGQFTDAAIFEVEFESREQNDEPPGAWIRRTKNVLDYDAQGAIDKTEALVVGEWKEGMRLLGVRMLARAEI